MMQKKYFLLLIFLNISFITEVKTKYLISKKKSNKINLKNITACKNYDYLKKKLLYPKNGFSLKTLIIKIMNSFILKAQNNLKVNRKEWILSNNINEYPNFQFIKKESKSYKKHSKFKKIIIIGDLHGNFNAFDLIITNLIESNILDKRLKLNKKYRIVALGDFIDRGLDSLEITLILMLLSSINNKRVTILKGNHEDSAGINTLYSNFYLELQQKINNYDEFIENNFLSFFKILPTAYFIKNKFMNELFLLNHGGWEKMPIYLKSFIDSNKKYTKIDDLLSKRLLWNDIEFNFKSKKIINGIRNSKELRKYPYNIVINSMDKNNITAKIGGHMHKVPEGKELPTEIFSFKCNNNPGFIRLNNIYILISGSIEIFDNYNEKIGYKSINYAPSYLKLTLYKKKHFKIKGYYYNSNINKFTKTKVPSYY